MSSSSSSGTNPLIDPNIDHGPQLSALDRATLLIEEQANIVFLEKCIKVEGVVLEQTVDSSCFGLIRRSIPNETIDYFNILDATIAHDETTQSPRLTVTYAKPKSTKEKAPLVAKRLEYRVRSSRSHADAWLAELLTKAYGQAQRHKRIKVLINPFGGVGKASAIYNRHIAPILEAANCHVDVVTTRRRGHAIDIAQALNLDEWDVLACASGDGLPMECFNGLAKKDNALEALKRMAVVQLPCGSGNAMSINLNGTNEPTRAALSIVKGVPMSFDLASVTQGDTRTLSFLSQSLGIVAESDLGTENIRWMGGFRFTFGFLVRLLGKTLYPIEYAVKTEIESKAEIKRHYVKEIDLREDRSHAPQSTASASASASSTGLPPLKYGTIKDPLPTDENSGWTKLEPYPNLGNFYCGNMCFMAADAPFFPASLPNDGLLDLITIDGDISRIDALKMLLAVEDGSIFDLDQVRVRKISAVRVIPKFGQYHDPEFAPSPTGWMRLIKRKPGSSKKPGYFAVDGESLPLEPFQVEIHQGLGTTLALRPGLYEFPGPKGCALPSLP